MRPKEGKFLSSFRVSLGEIKFCPNRCVNDEGDPNVLRRKILGWVCEKCGYVEK